MVLAVLLQVQIFVRKVRNKAAGTIGEPQQLWHVAQPAAKHSKPSQCPHFYVTYPVSHQTG